MTTLLTRDDVRSEEAPRTVLPARDSTADVPVPRTSLGVLPLEYRFLSWGARIAAIGLSWVIVERLLPIQGLGWFVVVAGICNLMRRHADRWSAIARRPSRVPLGVVRAPCTCPRLRRPRSAGWCAPSPRR